MNTLTQAADRKRALTESKDSVSSYRAKTMSTSAISRSYTIDDSHKMSVDQTYLYVL